MGDTATATSPRKREANRRNAKRSTGPRSPEGKAVSALNAKRHGLLMVSPVVAELERAEEWEAHRAALFVALRPADALEELLADRVALAAWRLDRVARYETDAIAVLQEKAEEGLEAARRLDPDADYGSLRAAEEMEEAKCRFQVFEDLADPANTIHPSWATDILGVAAAEVGAEGYPLPAGCPAEGAETWPKWTAPDIRACIAELAKQAGEDAGEVLRRVVASAREDGLKAQGELDRALAKLDRAKRESILPEADTIEKITRYEAHLERGLYRALHELEWLQARRAGANVPVPAVLDVDVAVGPRNVNGAALESGR